MSRGKRERHIVVVADSRPWLATIAWSSILVWIVALPLIVAPHGKETFRTPKDLVFIAEAIVLAAIGLIAWITYRIKPNVQRHPVVLIAGLALAWTAITTLTSANRALSVIGLTWVAASVVIAIGVTLFARTAKIKILYFALVPAAINAIVFLLQRWRIWTPMHFDPATPEHMQYTALIGNPDDVGSFLVAPMMIALALAVRRNGERKFAIPIAMLLGAALLTGQITSIVATVAGAFALAFVCSRRIGLITMVALAILIPAFVYKYKPLRERLTSIAASARSGDFTSATSGRVTPFTSALLMFRDRPFLGVGPDTFPWEYFPYKLRVERQNPKLVSAYVHSFNFGEVHNDHLQTLAETGIAGYAIFLAALWLLARRTWRTSTGQSPESDVARIASLPLAASLFVLCLAHFPLHLASATAMYLFIGMLCLGWSEPLVVETERRRGNAIPRLAMTTAIVGAAGFLLYAAVYEPYHCNGVKREMEQVTMRTLAIPDQMLAARRARRTIEILAPCGRRLPADVDYYMLTAANLRILGSPAEAEAMYTRALDFDRRPELYFGLGAVQLDQGKKSESIASFVNAVTFNRDMVVDLPAEVKPQVIAIVNRDFPYLGVAAQ